MRKAFKIIGIILGVIILFIVGAGFYVKTFLPDVGPAPELKVVSTPERVAHGKYLANHVMVCMDCHSTRKWNFYGGPMELDSLGIGGERFDQRAGFPGVIYAPNITPAGIGTWTDGEIFRAITTGVRKNGKPIFPVMPHRNYGALDRADIEAIVAYVRSLPPLENRPPDSEYDFPFNFIINTIPQEPNFTKKPDSSDRLAYGKYMIKAASCGDCHTPFESGKFDTAFAYAGGRTFQMPAGIVTSLNLTPDKETGIGSWTKEMFLNKFSVYRDSAYSHRAIDFMKDPSTVMPWPVYAGMSDNDLGAIYEYLQSLKPIKHQVVRFQAYPEKK
jgi:mono/diheme cytochrome c family protein